MTVRVRGGLSFQGNYVLVDGASYVAECSTKDTADALAANLNSHAALVEALSTEARVHPHDRECLCARCKALAAAKGDA